MGLTELMVALGILTIIVAGFSSYMGRVSKFQLSANNLADITVIKSAISQSVSCDATFNTAVNPNAVSLSTCLSATTGSPITIPLYSSSGGIVVSDGIVTTPTVNGKWTLRAQCVSLSGGGVGLEIRAAQPAATGQIALTSQGSFNSNPVLHTPYDWTNGPIISPASSLCASQLTQGTGGNTQGTGGNTTPKGMCQSFSIAVPRLSIPLMDNNLWRQYTASCPLAFPVMVTVNVAPACASSAWQSGINPVPQSYPTQGYCMNIFPEDAESYGTINETQLQSEETFCNNLGDRDYKTMLCNYLCCNF